MIILLVILSTFWAYEFLYIYAEWIPDYVSYFLLPVLAYGLFFLPHIILVCLGVTAVVGLLHRMTQRFFTVPQVQTPKKHVKFPPLP